MITQLLLLGTLTVTSYRPVAGQTDSSPTWTSIGDRTTKFGCAVSQDILAGGRVHYGDILYIEGYGYRVVNDCMNKRHKNHIDLLVFTHNEEKMVGTRHLNVYVISMQNERGVNKMEWFLMGMIAVLVLFLGAYLVSQ